MQVGKMLPMRAFVGHGKFPHIKISLTDPNPKILLQKMQFAAEIGLCPVPMEEADRSEPIIIASNNPEHAVEIFRELLQKGFIPRFSIEENANHITTATGVANYLKHQPMTFKVQARELPELLLPVVKCLRNGIFPEILPSKYY